MSKDDAKLIHLLTEQGRTWDEIEQTLEDVHVRDSMTIRDAIFDSIGVGHFDLETCIEETAESWRS